MSWLVRFALAALFPRQDDLPGVAELRLAEKVRDFRRDTNSMMWLGAVAGALLFQLSPLLTVHRPWPAVLLSKKQLDRHAYLLATHPWYLLRQMMMILKLAGGMLWGQSKEVRAFVNLPPLEADPGTRRTGPGLEIPPLGPRLPVASLADLGRREEERGRTSALLGDGEPVPPLTSARHLTFESFEQRDVDAEADFVVVGSGAGGAAAAVVLARAGRSVAIVEAGPWRGPQDYPWSTLGAMRDLFADWGALFTQSHAFWPIVQASCVGGTTVINSAIVVRTPEDCFDAWERDHGAPADLKIRVWKHQDRLDKELCAQVVPADARGWSSVLAMDAAQSMGFDSHYMTRTVRDCEGMGQCLQGCRKGRKQSTNVNYVPEVLARGGQVLSSAPVARVVFEGQRAVAVKGRFHDPLTRRSGARFTVRARKAVLMAASATQSPVLLARSGVRNPALGTGFRAHPGTGTFGVYEKPVDQNVGATQGWASTAFRGEKGMKLETLAIPAEMVAGRLPGGGTELVKRFREYRHMAMWVAAVRAEAVGTVKPGPLGGAVVRYQMTPGDMARLREGLAKVTRMHFAAGAREVVPGIFGLPYKIGPDEVKLIEEGPLDPRNYVAILSHLFGGCCMSADPARGVVDGRGKVHGYEGLYVVDAAAIPTTLGVNPQHTIMGLASAWAEELA